MNRLVKSLIGLAVALTVGAVAHGPFGIGEALIGRLEVQGQAVVAEQGVPGVSMVMQRAPLARTAILSGTTNRFQREGMGSLPGMDARVTGVPGIARVEWTSPPQG